VPCGPGWNPASAAPGGQGTVVISAHRDTHFAWLRNLAAGATLELEGVQGRRRYRLQERHILDVREHALAPEVGEDQLLLVTCWPFDAAEAGGPLRLVLRFLPLEQEALAQPGGSVPQPGAYSGAPS
jgi:sortase A